ncbi:hypothetical protein DYB32_005601 [Aphanomyces invadans]|uniref:Peptidase M20 dimerisation domain-containing protein n=1 Tax=Aphanomyces invadans TaxID=157072 RepID=A0A3R6ZPB8_9STRA|nr:hypothetical protein DYB32_005601 [Aphanomyces invadans]
MAAASTPSTADYSTFFDRLVSLRHHFHSHPELSFQEVITQQTLRRFLVDEAGIPETDVHAISFLTATCPGLGAVAMIKEGCLDGVDEVYGYHNVNFPENVVAVKAGAVMSHGLTFHITLKGLGGRNISAHDSAIVSIAQVHGGEADNVIPSSVVMSGTARDFSPAVADVIKARMTAIVTHTAAAYGVEGTIRFDERYPATVNAAAQAEIVREVALSVAGAANVTTDGLPLCASEDFSFYLQQRPGAFFFINTVQKPSEDGTTEQNRTLHSSTFDFNDAILPLSVRMFLELAQHRLACELYSPREMEGIYSPSTA